MGRILLPCATIVALTGLWITISYPWPAGDGQIVYLERLVFGSAMLLSIILGVGAIRRRNFVSHGEWMIREGPRAVMMGAGWAINMFVAEWIIRKPKPARRPVLRIV